MRFNLIFASVVFAFLCPSLSFAEVRIQIWDKEIILQDDDRVVLFTGPDHRVRSGPGNPPKYSYYFLPEDADKVRIPEDAKEISLVFGAAGDLAFAAEKYAIQDVVYTGELMERLRDYCFGPGEASLSITYRRHRPDAYKFQAEFWNPRVMPFLNDCSVFQIRLFKEPQRIRTMPFHQEWADRVLAINRGDITLGEYKYEDSLSERILPHDEVAAIRSFGDPIKGAVYLLSKNGITLVAAPHTGLLTSDTHLLIDCNANTYSTRELDAGNSICDIGPQRQPLRIDFAFRGYVLPNQNFMNFIKKSEAIAADRLRQFIVSEDNN